MFTQDEQDKMQLWKKNLTLFDGLFIGAFVRFENNDTIYSLRKRYEQPIGTIAFERMLELQCDDHVRLVGHMDQDVGRMVVVSNFDMEGYLK